MLKRVIGTAFLNASLVHIFKENESLEQNSQTVFIKAICIKINQIDLKGRKTGYSETQAWFSCTRWAVEEIASSIRNPGHNTSERYEDQGNPGYQQLCAPSVQDQEELLIAVAFFWMQYASTGSWTLSSAPVSELYGGHHVQKNAPRCVGGVFRGHLFSMGVRGSAAAPLATLF